MGNNLLQSSKGTDLVRDGWEWVGPGGRLHPEEFLERFYGHIIIEGLLAVIIGYLFFQSSFKSSGKSPKSLSEEASPSTLCLKVQSLADCCSALLMHALEHLRDSSETADNFDDCN